MQHIKILKPVITIHWALSLKPYYCRASRYTRTVELHCSFFYSSFCIVASYAIWSLTWCSDMFSQPETSTKSHNNNANGNNCRKFSFTPKSIAWRVCMGFIFIGFVLIISSGEFVE